MILFTGSWYNDFTVLTLLKHTIINFKWLFVVHCNGFFYQPPSIISFVSCGYLNFHLLAYPSTTFLPTEFIVCKHDIVMNSKHIRGRHGNDRMVVGYITTYAITAYHHYRCEFESCSWRGVLNTTLKFVHWLVTGQWFSPDTRFIHQ